MTSEPLLELLERRPGDKGVVVLPNFLRFYLFSEAEVIPEAITKTEWGIPSILEVSNVIGSNVISFTNFSTSNLDSNATALECLDVFARNILSQ